MNDLQLTDTVTLDGVNIRADGYLVADVKVSRTGVQRYLGSEVGKPELPFVDVYRPPEEVFSDEAMASFAHRPVTNDHPPEAVTAENWRKYTVGQTGDEIRQDGKFVRIPLMVADGKSIGEVKAGKRELSNGYKCDLDFTSGVTPDGETYDAVQRNIRGNHVAIVDAGRAGKECRIGDGAAKSWGASPITTADSKGNKLMENLQNTMVDGIPVQTNDVGVAIITKALTDRNGLQALLDKALADNKALAENHAKELAVKDATIDDLKANVLDAAAMDAQVVKRSALLDAAKRIIADVKTDGLTDAEVRKTVVVAKLGDEVLVGKNPDTLDVYVEARFDDLAEKAKSASTNDQFAQSFKRDANQQAFQSDSDPFVARDKALAGLIHFDQTGKELS